MSAPAWTDQTVADVLRMNRTGIVSGIGAYLAGLDLSQFKLLHCTSSGSGFTLDHVYLCETDGSGVIDLTSNPPHTHTNSTTDGGDYLDILLPNYTVVDVSYLDGMHVERWTGGVSGTGSVTTITSGGSFTETEILKVSTGTTSGSGAYYKLAALSTDWTYEAFFECLTVIETNISSIAFKVGMKVENPTASDDNARKMGFVGCTSVNGNFFARSADGDSRSDSDMGVTFDADSVQSLLAHKQESGGTIDYYVDGGNKLTKSSDVPTSGEEDEAGHFRIGVKNNTGANRVMYLGALRMTYHTTHHTWFAP